jgi:hypothetical protein
LLPITPERKRPYLKRLHADFILITHSLKTVHILYCSAAQSQLYSRTVSESGLSTEGRIKMGIRSGLLAAAIIATTVGSANAATVTFNLFSLPSQPQTVYVLGPQAGVSLTVTGQVLYTAGLNAWDSTSVKVTSTGDGAGVNQDIILPSDGGELDNATNYQERLVLSFSSPVQVTAVQFGALRATDEDATLGQLSSALDPTNGTNLLVYHGDAGNPPNTINVIPQNLIGSTFFAGAYFPSPGAGTNPTLQSAFRLYSVTVNTAPVPLPPEVFGGIAMLGGLGGFAALRRRMAR